MLNKSGITITDALTPKSILWAPEVAVGIPCVIGNASVTETDGKKIVKAGTPLTGDLTNRATAFTVASEATTAIGVALHDVDVTAGNQNATILVAGVVDLSKVDTTTAALITTDMKTALSKIIFVK